MPDEKKAAMRNAMARRNIPTQSAKTNVSAISNGTNGDETDVARELNMFPVCSYKLELCGRVHGNVRVRVGVGGGRLGGEEGAV